MSKILFILMPNHKDEEFNYPYEILSAAGHTIDIAGLIPGVIVSAGKHERSPNILFTKMTKEDFNKYDALVIPGGPGSQKYLWGKKAVLDVISYFHKNKKLIAAICYAVIPVVQAGILQHKDATVYPTDEAKAILEEYDVKFSSKSCVSLTQEKIITAQGPSAAKEFGKTILTFLAQQT